MSLLASFLNYKCYQEVLDIVDIKKNIDKEISEAMSIHKKVKKIVHSNKDKRYVHIDFCSGNALAPVLSAYTLSLHHSFAIDIKERKRKWSKVRNFSYRFDNIFNEEFLIDLFSFLKDFPIILTGIHSCGKLTSRIIEIYNNLERKEKYLFLMPCCIGNKDYQKYPQIMIDKLGKDFLWVYENYKEVNSKNKRMIEDKEILSPKNLIICASNKKVANGYSF